MKEIPLSQGMVALVSNEDYERVARFKWTLKRNGNRCYAYRRDYSNGGRHIPLHRFILDAPPEMEVDHINGDGLDNRRENIRLCTHSENSRNTNRASNNTSGYKGVSRDHRDGRWDSYITLNQRRIHIGRFGTAIEAARAYDAKAREIFGEFAKLNFTD